ncbi:TPA: exotoxin OB-fold domain-containing protein [Staphylococcus aureus]|uniref:exotoxin OB-fold domain-containing protein n=1 Tax=Staphylococcus aureus TaxID=1280 RepID=UPI000D1166C0
MQRKNVDIFGVHFGANCVGEVGENSACLYGGVTFHEKMKNNKKVNRHKCI